MVCIDCNKEMTNGESCTLNRMVIGYKTFGRIEYGKELEADLILTLSVQIQKLADKD